MRNYVQEMKDIIKKVDIALGKENKKRILEIEGGRLIGEARNSEKGREDLSVIHMLFKDKKEELEKL